MELDLSEADPECELKYDICVLDTAPSLNKTIVLMEEINCLDFAKDLSFTYFYRDTVMPVDSSIYGFYPELVRGILEQLRTKETHVPAICMTLGPSKEYKDTLTSLLEDVPKEAQQYIIVEDHQGSNDRLGNTQVYIRLDEVHPVVFHALAFSIRNTLIDKPIFYRGTKITAKFLMEYAMRSIDIPIDQLLKQTGVVNSVSNTIYIATLHNHLGSMSFLQGNIGGEVT